MEPLVDGLVYEHIRLLTCVKMSLGSSLLGFLQNLKLGGKKTPLKAL